ncbi:MAG TPA: dockerin type I domain-containing protein [Chloroflexota bacterium]|nr:dockerin type I domain-containing protein [Chloroflexota bacterium]
MHARSCRWALVGLVTVLLGLGVFPPPAAPAARAQRPPEQEREASPAEREAYFYWQRAAPAQTIPPGALARARAQLEAALQRGTLQRAPQGVPSAQGVVETPWVAIGPQPIGEGLAGFGAGQLPNAGRVTALAVDPSDPSGNTVYLGAATGGVWKTTNGGVTWLPLTDTQPSLAIGAIALDPTQPQTVYVGLGEQNFSGDSYYGFGILKSTNGGASWTLLPAGCATDPGCPFQRQRIGRIAVDPNNPQIVYAATTNGIAKSSDGGQSWTVALLCASSPCSRAVTDVVIDASTSPSTIYAAQGDPFGAPNNGVWKSTTNLANTSANWTKLPGSGSGLFPASDVGRIRLSLGRSGGTTALYAVVHRVSDDGLMGVWKTTDGGATWTATAHPETASGAAEFSACTQCEYNLNIAVFPTNPNVVYVLAIELFRSTDGGASWSQVSNGYTAPYKIHVDQHAFAFLPGNPNAFYVGNDGGVYRSTDGGTSYTNLNGSLSITQFYRGAAHPTRLTSAFGGTQDNGSLSYENALSWYRALRGDGGYAAIDFVNPNTVYATTQMLGIWRSTTGPRGTFTPADAGISGSEPRQFIAPLVMDPQNPQVLYAGTTRLYRTSNGAASWAPISPVLSSASNRFNAISAVVVAPSDPSTLYVGTGASSSGPAKLWVTRDLGGSWTDRSAGLPNRFITSIAVHPTDPSTAYVAFSGFDANTPSAPGHVFKTTNGGAGWTNVTGALPDAPVNAIVIDPSDGQQVYVATDVGVFKSPDGGSSWQQLAAGLPNPVVNDLVLHRSGQRLFAFTHGRGVYVAERTLPCDINRDGRVDIFDFSLLVQNFGKQELGNPADCNGDGRVDIFDFSILVQNFGRRV